MSSRVFGMRKHPFIILVAIVFVFLSFWTAVEVKAVIDYQMERHPHVEPDLVAALAVPGIYIVSSLVWISVLKRRALKQILLLPDYLRKRSQSDLEHYYLNVKKLTVIGLVVVFLLHSAAEETKLFVDRYPLSRHPHDPPSSGITFVYILALLLASYFANRFGHHLTRPRTRSFLTLRNGKPKQHLILFLSNLTRPAAPPKEFKAVVNRWIERKGVPFEEGLPEKGILVYKLDEDIDELARRKPREESDEEFRLDRIQAKANEEMPTTGTMKPLFWPWEMPLRAIRKHLPKLKTVHLFCSKRSTFQLGWFRDLIAEYKNNSRQLMNVKFIVVIPSETPNIRHVNLLELDKIDDKNLPAGWNFEEFDEISEGLYELAEHLSKNNVPENEVIVDFTSGQKPNTVAAAMMTANRHVVAQYIRTNDPWDELEYDLVTTAPRLPSLEH